MLMTVGLPKVLSIVNSQETAVFYLGALTEIRTPVLSLKGLRPSPLDDEGKRMEFYHPP